MFVLMHLLKIETILKVARLHFHLQTWNCVFYRSQCFFPAPSNHRETPTFAQTHLTVFLCHNRTWKVWCQSPPTCSTLSFWCPHILMQSLEFHAVSLKFSIIQPCHSASHLVLRHYHTNTAMTTKGSELGHRINLSNGQIEPLAPQPCQWFQ